MVMRDNKQLKRKVRNSYLISTISIAMVLFLLGSVGYLSLTAYDVSQSLRESITATVELTPSNDAARREEIRRVIAEYPLAGEVRYSSKDEKIRDEEFQRMFGLEFEAILKDNPLMDSFEVSLAADLSDSMHLAQFAKEVEAIAGVSRVNYPAALVTQVHSTMSGIQLLIMLFGAALLFVSLVLLNNTIRMAIFSRRTLINTMKLVGATRWFIMRPFLWSGIVSGFWAGVVASLLFGGALYGVNESMVGLFSMSELYRAGSIAGVMVGGGVVISLIFTWMAVSRFVNMNRNKINLY